LVTIDESQGGSVFASLTAGGHDAGGGNGLMGDGSVRFINDSMNGMLWRAAFDRRRAVISAEAF
jgi:hypothetical protein